MSTTAAAPAPAPAAPAPAAPAPATAPAASATATAPASAGDHGLRERKKRQTRQAIHAAAIDLVTARGLAGVTVEEICATAEVSPRTFFNYFPSKGDAALGLPPAIVPADARAVFLAADGPLVSDLCDLMAQTVTLPTERRRMKQLVRARPEMVPTMLQWMAAARSAIHEVASERTDTDTARTAVLLVLAAAVEVAHRSSVETRDELAAELRATVGSMGRLAGG